MILTRKFQFFAIFCILAAGTAASLAQGTLRPAPSFAFSRSPLAITRPAQPRLPFTVAGEGGAILGRQNGSFELWLFPVKVLSHFRMVAELSGYPVPIEVNKHAAVIEVHPDHTTITYSHAAIVIKQHMFAPRGAASDKTGAVVLFEIQSTHPATLTLQFEPILARQWPAPNFGRPSASWFTLGEGGGFLLNTDDPRLFGAIAMPHAASGVLPPYQERPKAYPLEFKLSFDPARDAGVLFPLVAAVSEGSAEFSAKSPQEILQKLSEINRSVPALYAETRDYYEHFFDNKLTVETPDHSFDLALRWAELAIDQMRVRHHGEIGLVAGWYSSGDSARPGFGWFFGRDTLWSLYAVHSYGDFELSRKALEFLIRRQRADGKIMHEYSQTAELVDWRSFPYEYAAADSTPLFVMVVEDYVRATGDVGFLRDHWNQVKLAYAFTRAHDSDSDGVYDNSEGTGWVESWPAAMPHQELYLASLDQQSASAMARLAHVMGEEELSRAAQKQAELIRSRLLEYRAKDGLYAFSKNRDGSFDLTPTIFPSVAWWSGTLKLPDAGMMFRHWASSDFSTDWGTRAVAASSPVYDPMSYHQGTVWPLFTGWASLAEYRTNRPLVGYRHLMENANLTWAQDLGAVTEVLSGEFFEPLGRSSAHQLWSSAMVLSPAIRGLFGIEADVPRRNLHVSPQLPADWDQATLQGVPFGNSRLNISMTRRGGDLVVEAVSSNSEVLCLIATLASTTDPPCQQLPATKHLATIHLAPVEIVLPQHLPTPGSRTLQARVVEENYSANELSVTFEVEAGTVLQLPLRNNTPSKQKLTVTGGELRRNDVLIKLPPGSGFQMQTVKIGW